jgi:hypothetical protein
MKPVHITLLAICSVLAGCLGATPVDTPTRGVDTVAASFNVCGSDPDVALRLVRAGPSSAATHWNVGDGCIPVTYDPSLAALLPEITAAVNAWRFPCASYCLESPVARVETAPYPERRIHFDSNTTRATGGVVEDSQTIVTFASNTGVILGADIIFLADRSDVPARLQLTRSVGRALGFAAPSIGTDASISVLSLRATNPTPTDIDRRSVCAYYGAQPWCR